MYIGLIKISTRPFIKYKKLRRYFHTGLAILTYNSKKNHETFGSKVGVYLVFVDVTEEGWVRRGGRKRKRGLCGNFPLELLVRITFPFP